MEYLRKVSLADGPTAAAGSADSRVMDFGSVFLDSKSRMAKLPYLLGLLKAPSHLVLMLLRWWFPVALARLLGTEIMRKDLTIMMPFLLLLFPRRGGYILPRIPQ